MPPVKIFIDSQLRVHGTNSSFEFQLPRPVSVDKDYRVMCDQVHVPHTFQTIHSGNRAIYFREIGTHDRQHKVLLTPKQYDGPSLATEVAHKLNQATTNTATWTVTFDADQGKLNFSISAGTAKIYGMEYLLNTPNSWVGFSGETVGDHDSAGPIIGVHGMSVLDVSSVAVQGSHISVIPFHTLYLHCDRGFGDGESAIGPKGNSSVLRSIPVQSSYGSMLHDLSLNPHDHTTLKRGQMGTFKFRLADKHGRAIDLDQSFSFSLLLTPVDEFE